jgi:site-specific DNA-methyltransferase (adenine-specific)
MGIRVLYMRELLKPTGSFYYHCDPTASHYIKMMLDMIFGMDNFRNEIVWCYTGPSAAKRYFPEKHDVIFLYTKSDNYTFNPDLVRIPYKGGAPAAQGPNRKWVDNEEERIKKAMDTGKIVEDYWTDITLAIRSSKENLGYPTQKPEKLLERIILASSNPKDLVVDFYLGGGTTIAVAEKLDRNWIGIDINPRALEISEKRIRDLGKVLKKDFIVSGIPKSSKELRQLIEANVYGKDKNSKFALEDIVCKYYLKNVVGNEKKVGDDSIDGRFMFDFEGDKCSGIVQVTTSGNKTHLKNSCETMSREGHKMLIYVTFEDKITDPLKEIAKKYKKIGGVDRVQLLSLEDLIDKGKQFDLPKDENTILGFDILSK